jgi:multidrug efflux system outer membrane protein
VEAAEASARAAGATLYPQVNLGARGGGKLSGDGSGMQGIGLFASWELDLWGRVRAQRESATAQYQATVLDARYARASIAALTAKSWFLAREAVALGAIARDMVATSESLAGLSRDRQRVGNADELEVAQADASTLAYRDVVLQTDLARQNALRAIEILAGRYPSAQLDVGTGLPPPPASIPVGLPSQLLERRPDVRAAERRVAAAFYATEEAKAARLPRIALTGSVSSISSDLFVLKERDNPVWSWGGTLAMSIFNAGALQAQVDARSAQQKAAVAEYGRVGTRAFAEVENALSASFNLDNRASVLAAAVQANDRALGFTRVRYDVGSSDLRSVQSQLLSLSSARTSLVHVQAERLIQRVNLHLALGGGFDLPPEATAAR